MSAREEPKEDRRRLDGSLRMLTAALGLACPEEVVSPAYIETVLVPKARLLFEKYLEGLTQRGPF